MQNNPAIFSVFAASDSGTKIKTLQTVIIDPKAQNFNLGNTNTNLVFVISAHGDQNGNIYLEKDPNGSSYLQKPALSIIKQILSPYKDVKDIEIIKKTIIILQCFAGSIRKQLEKGIGYFTEEEKKLFSKLDIFTYAPKKYPQHNIWINKKLVPLLKEYISNNSFNRDEFIQKQVAAGLPFNMMSVQDGQILQFNYNSKVKNSIKAKVTFSELLNVMNAYDSPEGLEAASKVLKEKNDKIIDELSKKGQLSTNTDTYKTTLKAQFQNPKTKDEIEDWIRDSYAWIANQLEGASRSKDAVLLLMDPVADDQRKKDIEQIR